VVLRIVAIVQACRVRRAYGACIGRRDALPVRFIEQRNSASMTSMAQDHPTFSDVEPGE
jgi:hypothetical protein